MLKRLLPFLLLLLFVEFYSQARIIYSTQNGNWEDSTTWWGIDKALSDTLDGDTIIISHHINFNNPLLLSNCFITIEIFGSLCGHYTVHFYQSQLYQYGGFYSQYVYSVSSNWFCYHGYFVHIDGAHFTGTGGPFVFMACCGCAGHSGGGFNCTIPVESWRDTTKDDSIIIPPPPLSIKVYPNPFLDQFIIDSEIPDGDAPVVLNIYDILGRKMISIPLPDGKSSLTVFSNNWAPGMYLLRFEQGGDIIQTDKIVRVQ